MRPWILLLSYAVFCSGCTHAALERRTLKQASTLPDLQYRQVLDNLAMFACNRDALAWHIKVTGGTIQMTDSGSAGFAATIASNISDSVKNLFFPSVAGQRTALQQWNVDPTIESDELRSLQLAYQKAIDPADPTIQGGVLRRICDIALKFGILPGEETLEKISDDSEHQVRLAKAIIEQVNDVPQISQAAKQADFDENRERLAAAHLEALTCLFKPASVQDPKLNCALNCAKESLNQHIDGLSKFPTQTEALNRVKARFSKVLDRLRGSGAQSYRLALRIPRTVSGRPTYGADDAARIALAIAEDPVNQILTGLQVACGGPYSPSATPYASLNRNPGLIDQAQDKIEALQDLIEEGPEATFNQPWLCVGPKKAVPKCACYVGHYCHCGCDRYVWVPPDRLKTLRDFTLLILTLAPPDKQDLASALQRGAAVGPPSR